MHCVFRELEGEHHEFEVASDDYIPTTEYISGDLDILMKNGVEQGKIDWENWENTKDPSIPIKKWIWVFQSHIVRLWINYPELSNKAA